MYTPQGALPHLPRVHSTAALSWVSTAVMELCAFTDVFLWCGSVTGQQKRVAWVRVCGCARVCASCLCIARVL
jgi:hypothetical protein